MSRQKSLIQKKLINQDDIYRYLKNPTVKRFKSLFYTPWFRKIRSRLKKRKKKRGENNNSSRSIYDDDSLLTKVSSRIQLPITFKAFVTQENPLNKIASTATAAAATTTHSDDDDDNNNVQMIIQYREITVEMKDYNFYHVLHPSSLENVSLIFHRDIHYTCPVCLNETCSIRTAFIYNCGHLMCLSCVYTMMESFPESRPADLFSSCYYKCTS